MKFPALFDVLFEMTEGDSPTVWQVVDSTMKAGITRAFPGMDVKEIRYEVVLVNQFSKEELAEKEAVRKSENGSATSRCRSPPWPRN